MNEQNNIGAQHFMYKNIGWLAIALIVIAIIGGVSLIKNWKYIGMGQGVANTIIVTADGEIRADKDTATFTFTHTAEAKTAREASKKLTEKVTPALDAVYALGIEKKDVNTENVSLNPQYRQALPCTLVACPPYNQNPEIIGWQASQTVSIKVRDLTKFDNDIAGTVFQMLAEKGITNVYGPNFDIDADKQSDLRVEARKLAIEKAQSKAKVLADQLGVTLVRVVSFNEGNDNMYFPQYNMKATMSEGMGGGADTVALPTGEGKIRSNVTITYEIR